MSAIDAIKKRRIIDPSAIERLSQIIQADMVEALGGAPAAEPSVPLPETVTAPSTASTRLPRANPEGVGDKVDLRTLRRTGRTFAVNTKIKPESGEKLTQLARATGKSLAEVIEDLISIASK
jgi:hypothetical protein